MTEPGYRGKLVLDEPAEGVARLRIVNPQRRGALDHEILDTLAETVRSLDAPCLLLTGTGKVFSAGYDLGNLEGRRFEEAAEKLVAHPFHSAIEALDAYPYPVVAALNGHAIGGGLELALTCDIRLAAREAKMGMPPAKLGLIYSHTGLRRFVEACGAPNTAELFYTAQNVDAERGLQMGLVGHVVDAADLDERAVAMAAGHRLRRAAVAGRQQAHPARAPRPGLGAAARRRAGADRPARVVLHQPGLRRGRARLRREARAEAGRGGRRAPGPSGAPPSVPGRGGRCDRADRGPGTGQPHPPDLRAPGPARPARRPPGAVAVLGQPPRPGRPPPCPRGRRRRRHALRRGRRLRPARVGDHAHPPPARGAPGRLPRPRERAAHGLALPGADGRDPRAGPRGRGGAGRRRARTRRPPTAAAWPRPRPCPTATATSSTWSGACCRRRARAA